MEPSSFLGGGAGTEAKMAQDCLKGPSNEGGAATEGSVKPSPLALGVPLCFSCSQLVRHRNTRCISQLGLPEKVPLLGKETAFQNSEKTEGATVLPCTPEATECQPSRLKFLFLVF